MPIQRRSLVEWRSREPVRVKNNGNQSYSSRPRASGPRACRAQVLSLVHSMPVCPLCGYCETFQAFRDNGCCLRTCSVCGLFFVHPYPNRVSQYARVSSGASDQIAILDCERRHLGERLYYERHLASIIEECRGAKSLLDVGCGTGYLLGALSKLADLYTEGIELNAQAARFARGFSGRPISEVPFEEFRSGRKYDAITLINVFSHVPSFDRMFPIHEGCPAAGRKSDPSNQRNEPEREPMESGPLGNTR